MTTAPGFDLAALRTSEFPWADAGESVYLNNASTGPLPARTEAALAAFTAKRARPWRLSHEEQFGALSDGRARIARLLNADPGEIALMVNTTYGINLAARALPLAPGSIAITYDGEFPANVYPWMALARSRGVALERVPLRDALPDEDALVARLEDPRVRLCAVSWVQFATGFRSDLARIGAACRARGVWFVVDAIQGIGAAPLDLAAAPVDILSCGAQKWLLSPWGTGFTYVRRGLAEQLAPADVGWMSVRGSDDFSRLVEYDLTWREDARRFEVITLPFQDFAGMDASLALLEEVGPVRAAAHVSALADRIVRWALDRDDVRLVTPADPARRAGIVSVRPRDPRAAGARLGAARVAFSLREGAIRLSPHFYNTPDEVDAALAALAG